ncbi:hypothetical protein psal_cds_104 [Pandoravirus salinus]|uniref:Uncharacterized protein n=1 Tax=Pandoravirus salinus TaxID=1349410 RepID=S4W0E2_9VIRU|nr:hypothetical protein psal_cds_104 [Pandoravirus salinus]AGO83540.1 hypothetical protein psal_cds_104 [Pandoravirus salinus]
MDRDRHRRAMRWWPCWTVAPALVVAMVVFAPWYAWRLAPGYAILDRVERASCLVLAHNASVTLCDSASAEHDGAAVAAPRLRVRFQMAGGAGTIETWAQAYLADTDSCMDADGAAAFFVRFPIGASAPCYYDPDAPADRVAMHDDLPSLGRDLFLAAWCAICAAVCSVAVSFSVVACWTDSRALLGSPRFSF